MLNTAMRDLLGNAKISLVNSAKWKKVWQNCEACVNILVWSFDSMDETNFQEGNKGSNSGI